MSTRPAASCAALLSLMLGAAACHGGATPEPGSGAAAIAAPDPGSPVSHPVLPGPPNVEEAIARIEETRISGSGTLTPPELKHYPDRRRFLALQIADAQEARLPLPHDDAELIELIGAGRLVRLSPLTDTYVLYEIGEDANDDPLNHYDARADKEVPLLPSMDAVEQKKAELAAGGATGRSQKAMLTAYYGDASRRDQLLREYQEVATFAAANGYSLGDPADRTRLHKDLLTYLRPEARDVLLKIADAYHRRFGRLLPVTSLIRTALYQRRLGGVNPNATRVEIPPHATGEAFDISYRYMAFDEQNFVMDLVAKLEDERKVEALRERRGHIHTYVFAGGDRPPEAMVQAARQFVDAARAERQEGTASRTRASRHAKTRPPARQRRSRSAAAN